MNTRELRIGNFVRVDGRIVKVNGITRHKIGYAPEPNRERYARAREVKPVVITHEIFDRCRFQYDMIGCAGWREKYDGTLAVTLNDDDKYVADTLHDLQNLYFAMTHEELEFRED